MTGKADAIRSVSEQFKAKLIEVVDGVMAHLRDDNAKEILGPGLSPLIGRGSLKSLVTFALYADVLRMVRDMVMADGEISDEEVQESLGLLSVLAEGFARVRKDYAEFTPLSHDTTRHFLAKYESDAGLFGRANEATRWAGIQLCRNIQSHCGESAPLKGFGGSLMEWSEAIATADAVTLSEQGILQDLKVALGRASSFDAVAESSESDDGRILTEELAQKYASDSALSTDDADVRRNAVCELTKKLELYQSLTKGAARALATLDCDLCLDGVTALSLEAAQALIPHRGSLSLAGIKAISPDVAVALSHHTGILDRIAPEAFYDDSNVFAALRRHPSLAVQPMTDSEMTAILGRKKFDPEGWEFPDATTYESVELQEVSAGFECCFSAIREANGRPIWRVEGASLPERGSAFDAEVAGATYYFIGWRDEVRSRLEQLPDRVLTAKAVRNLMKKGNFGCFQSFGAIDLEAARILGEEYDWTSEEPINLDGIRILSRDVAEALSKPQPHDDEKTTIPSLSLSGLTSLDDDVAQSLGRRRWSLKIRVPSLSPIAASALGCVHSLDIEILEGISGEAAEKLLQAGGGGEVLFIKVPQLPADAARFLAQISGPLYIEGLQSLSADAARYLASHVGNLGVNGLDQLPVTVAKILKQHPCLA